MKKLLFIIGLTLLGCSKEESAKSEAQSCTCIKEYYEINSYVTFPNGMPQTNVVHDLVDTELVPCQDEKRVDYDTRKYFRIKCN